MRGGTPTVNWSWFFRTYHSDSSSRMILRRWSFIPVLLWLFLLSVIPFLIGQMDLSLCLVSLVPLLGCLGNMIGQHLVYKQRRESISLAYWPLKFIHLFRSLYMLWAFFQSPNGMWVIVIKWFAFYSLIVRTKGCVHAIIVRSHVSNARIYRVPVLNGFSYMLCVGLQVATFYPLMKTILLP